MTHITFEAEPGSESGAPSLTIPRPVARMMVGFAALALVAAGLASWSGAAKRSGAPLAEVVAGRFLSVRDGAEGTLVVADPSDGKLVATLPESDATFLRSLVRGVTGGRSRDATREGAVVALELRSDGQLTVRSPESGAVASVNAFGQTQVASLRALMVKRRAE